MFETVTDLESDRDVLKNRAYGVIEVCDQELKAIHLRPYPKLISIAEIKWGNFWKKRSQSSKDRVLLYYNQPIMHRNFLALKYFVSDNKSSLASIAISLSVLDYIASVKRIGAVLTEITNDRIKDRHLQHFGWEEHLQHQRGRHWIKRFYGQYPETFLFQELQRRSSAQQLVPQPKFKPGIKPQPSMPLVVSPGNETVASSEQTLDS